MKKFINRAENVVEEMLQGLAVLNPGLIRLAGHKVMVRADAEQVRDQQVAIISGGGSGHEPAHAGYIGAGMLSAAVAGEVFTSPSSDSVFAAIKAVSGKAGVLLVVKNYTGDRLNFGLAAEMTRADGVPVEMVIVDDDVAAGARGLAGTVFIHKLVGAAAAEGRSVADVTSIGRAAIQSLATMGVSFSAGTSPAVGRPSFELGENEMELGLGIHGEPGVKRTHLEAADQLTETLLNTILEHRRFGDEKRVAVMVNNLGATTPMELAIVSRHAMAYLESRGFATERIYAGTFLSSLDMAGISISVLGVNDERLRLLDAATTAPAWPNALKQRPGKPTNELIVSTAANANSVTTSTNEFTVAGRKTRRAIEAACHALIEAEGELTEMDRITGDGDLGISMKRAASAMLDELGSYPLNDFSSTLKALGHTLRRELGGSSGPLYGVLFLRCAQVLKDSQPEQGQWIEALEQGCRAISELGGANPGDRTMLDALDPFVKSLKGVRGVVSREAFLTAVQEAERGVEATARMKPRLGRSSYLGNRVLGHPDPGAKAVSIWLRAAAEGLFVS